MSLEVLEQGRTGAFLPSKKNRVFKSSVDGESYVVKVYRGEWRERAAAEFKVLQDCRAKGVPVPAPMVLLEGAVVMAPVDGQVVGDVFDGLLVTPSAGDLTSEQERLADSLARWLAGFHAAFDFGLARGDTILRNFIMSEQGVVGLDFEEAVRGDTLPDIGQLCASVMMTDPAFTGQKVEFARHLADRYWTCSGQRRSDELGRAVSASIRHYAQFRSNGPMHMAYASRIERGEVTL